MADKLTLDRMAMKNRATAHLRIYVGGLTDMASVEDLYEHFIHFGKIDGIVINRGFGFVQFAEESSAIDAINQADGSVFQGKQLTVKTTSKRREPEQSQHLPQQQHQHEPQQQHQQQPQQQHQQQPQQQHQQQPQQQHQQQPQQQHQQKPQQQHQQQPQQQHQQQSQQKHQPLQQHQQQHPPQQQHKQQQQSQQQHQQQHQPQQQKPQKQQDSVVEPKAAENPSAANEEVMEDLYDNQGNYIGDQQRTKTVLSISLEYESDKSFRDDYREQEPYDNYNQRERGERGGLRGRGTHRGRGKPLRGRGGVGGFRERSPIRRGGEWIDRPPYDRYTQPMAEYPRALPVPERNDCEIIVVSKSLTEYAEYLETRLKRLGIVVDLLFPMEDVPIGKVLGNIASRGCLYAILVMPTNQEHRSLTLTILHGLPQEHRNMPVEEALTLLSRNFAEVQRGGSTGREAVYALLGQLADGRTLTALQYDKVIDYLKERREQQVKIELGEPLAASTNNKTQVDLQQRILSILNDKKIEPTPAPFPAPVPAPAAAPAPVIIPASVAPSPAEAKSKLLNDPTVRKALDSILQKFV